MTKKDARVTIDPFLAPAVTTEVGLEVGVNVGTLLPEPVMTKEGVDDGLSQFRHGALMLSVVAGLSVVG